MIGKISIFQSRSQLSVGSSRRRGSSIGGSSKITNEVQSYIAELGTDCLTPTLLAGWIRSKGEEFGSIYLVPYSPDGRRSCLSHETGARDSKISRGMLCLNIIFCLSGFFFLDSVLQLHNVSIFLGSDSRQGELLAYRYSIEPSVEAQKRLRYMTLR